MPFVKATKEQARAKVGLFGPSGSGKTWTSLAIASVLAEGKPIAVIDTENNSASKYSGRFSFDTCSLKDFSPNSYINAMAEAQAAGYGTLVIDSLSHAWVGRGGVLEIVDTATSASRSKNQFTEGWRAGTPEQNKLVEAILACECHLICTMRAKTEYVIDGGNGQRSAPRKVGLAPVQRDGMEYEFDIVGDMDIEHRLSVSKSRCEEIPVGSSYVKPGKEFAETILKWLNDGVPAEDKHKKAIEDLNDAILLSGNPAKTEAAILEKEGVDTLMNVSTLRAIGFTKILRERAEARDEHPVRQ